MRGRPGIELLQIDDDSLQTETIRWRRDAEIRSRMTREGAYERVLRPPLATDVDQRSDDDSHHIVEEFVAFYLDQRDAIIAMRRPHVDAKYLSHRVRPRIRGATEGSKVVLSDQRLRDCVEVRVVEPLHDAPGSAFQKRIAHQAVQHAVSVNLAGEVAARIEARLHVRGTHNRDLVRQVLRDREHPTAESDVLVAVEARELPFGVHACVSTTEPARLARFGIDRGDRAFELTCDA